MAATRILVADDDPWILRMVTTVLKKRGYVVETASDGEEAFTRAVASPPDLIISDIMMPKMDGWDLIRALRSRQEFAFVPVIFLTALASDDDRIQGFRLGADDYLAKPFRFEELDLRVEKTLKRGQMVEQMARERIGASEATPRPRRADTQSGLAGLLDEVGVPALLTLLDMERKTGVLVVRRVDGSTDAETGEVARVYLRDGRVLSAELEGLDQPKNAACIYHLVSWSSGHFDFEACPVDRPDEVEKATHFLLMEGARLLDEKNA